MKYYREYQLAQDTPTAHKGEKVKFLPRDSRYYFIEPKKTGWELDRLDFDRESFSLEQVQQEQWFQPLGEPLEYIPQFPPYEQIDEYLSLVGDTRLIDEIDFIRAVTPVFYSDEYKRAVYETLKKMYEDKYLSYEEKGETKE